MQPTPRELGHVAQWAAALRGEATPGMPPPFGFLLGGRPVRSLLPGWARDHSSSADNPGFGTEVTTHTDPVSGLTARVEAHIHSDFPAAEWVLHLRNDGSEDTPLLEAIQALSVTLPLPADAPCTVRYALGATCTPDDFAPRTRALTPRGSLRLQPGGGRSSSMILPFFNLDLGGEGVMLAVGWTGEWAVEFARSESGALSVNAGMDLTRLKLHPGEEVRTPRILLIFWEGDRLRGHNLLRRFILAHHRPRPLGQPLVAPLCNGNWGGTPASTHFDNCRIVEKNGLAFEYYWIDAEWFGKPGPWMENAGNWAPRADLYPKGFRPISDLLHQNGRKLLLWFEPERVAPGTPWALEHADWLLEVPPEQAIAWADYGVHMSQEEWAWWECHRNQLNRGDRLLNLGNPEALRFLTDFLSERIDEFGIDCFRQDSNIAQLRYWRNADAPERQGMTEIRYVEGQYALWDELLARHPGLIIDNCASGGRRIDLESISRTTPLWRTDYINLGPDRIAMQCHTWGLLHWVPLNGTTCGYLNATDNYTLRSSFSSALQAGLWGHGDAQQEPIPGDYPFDHARELLEQYLSVREYFYGDYYPLTEYSQAADAWMAYQLDRPEQGDGLVVVLKRSGSPFTKARFPLHAVRPEPAYEVTDLDSGTSRTIGGEELLTEGLEVVLRERPASALVRYAATER
jgi:alpha-galactosidase